MENEIIPPRSFNTVTVRGNIVIKSSRTELLKGEMYFYRNIPNEIQDLFPKVKGMYRKKETSFIKMSRIIGTPVSFFFLHRQLTIEQLEIILSSMERIHNTSSKIGERCIGNIYANYSEKLRQRIIKGRNVYYSLHAQFEQYIKDFLGHLEIYEKEKKGIEVSMIHGDAVFTNIILDSHNKTYFIDMRGALGDCNALHGDVVYDFAKVYQSLCGYDFIIHDQSKQLHHLRNSDYWKELESFFWDYVSKRYPIIKRNLYLITASLVLSLIPLHKNPTHIRGFWKLFRYLLYQFYTIK